MSLCIAPCLPNTAKPQHIPQKEFIFFGIYPLASGRAHLTCALGGPLVPYREPGGRPCLGRGHSPWRPRKKTPPGTPAGRGDQSASPGNPLPSTPTGEGGGPQYLTTP
jgi:hypothetical protein